MKTAGESDPSDLLPGQRMGRLGVELLMKATLCAGMIALVAGMVAALVGR